MIHAPRVGDRRTFNRFLRPRSGNSNESLSSGKSDAEPSDIPCVDNITFRAMVLDAKDILEKEQLQKKKKRQRKQRLWKRGVLNANDAAKKQPGK